jgi:hypothetical protein
LHIIRDPKDLEDLVVRKVVNGNEVAFRHHPIRRAAP